MKTILSVLMVCFLGLFPEVVVAKKITIAADPWCPYTCTDIENKPGFMIEVTRAILEKRGYEIDYQIINWARAILSAREGKFDAIVGATLEDAPDFLYPEIPQGSSEVCVFLKSGVSWSYREPKDFGKIKIGVIKDYAYNSTVDKYVKENLKSGKLTVLTGENEVLKRLYSMLEVGRIQAIIENKNVFQYSSALNKWKASQVSPAYCFKPQGVYTAFSPKSFEAGKLKGFLSEGMIELKKTGEWEKILKKYSMEKYSFDLK